MSNEDPFAEGIKVPSFSFKHVPVDTTVQVVITRAADKVQSRNFETGNPDYWDEAKTQPKYSAVFNGTVNGEERAFWCQIPSSLFAAIAEAQKQAGTKLDVGGTLLIRRLADKPNSNPRLNPAKQFAAKYTPPVQDAFSDEPPF